MDGARAVERGGMKPMRRYVDHWRDDLGEMIVVVIGVIITLAVMCLLWLAVVQIESWFR
jgi:hypothetical protein